MLSYVLSHPDRLDLTQFHICKYQAWTRSRTVAVQPCRLQITVRICSCKSVYRGNIIAASFCSEITFISPDKWNSFCINVFLESIGYFPFWRPQAETQGCVYIQYILLAAAGALNSLCLHAPWKLVKLCQKPQLCFDNNTQLFVFVCSRAF